MISKRWIITFRHCFRARCDHGQKPKSPHHLSISNMLTLPSLFQIFVNVFRGRWKKQCNEESCEKVYLTQKSSDFLVEAEMLWKAVGQEHQSPVDEVCEWNVIIQLYLFVVSLALNEISFFCNYMKSFKRSTTFIIIIIIITTNGGPPSPSSSPPYGLLGAWVPIMSCQRLTSLAH